MEAHVIETLAGAFLFASGVCLGAFLSKAQISIFSTLTEEMADMNHRSLEVLQHIALFRTDKAEALKDDKVPALYFGPDGKLDTRENVEAAEGRLSSVTNQMLNQIELADERAKQMMS